MGVCWFCNSRANKGTNSFVRRRLLRHSLPTATKAWARIGVGILVVPAVVVVLSRSEIGNEEEDADEEKVEDDINFSF